MRESQTADQAMMSFLRWAHERYIKSWWTTRWIHRAVYLRSVEMIAGTQLDDVTRAELTQFVRDLRCGAGLFYETCLKLGWDAYAL